MKRVLRRVKQELKKAVNRRLSKRLNKKQVKKLKASKAVKQKAPGKELPVEVKVGEAKFYTPVATSVTQAKRVPPVPSELPASYLQDRIVVQVRDPWWIYAYWEITESTWERLGREFSGDARRGFKKVLRVYDVSQIIFKGDNAHRYFDIEINHEASNWYIDTQDPARSWCVDFGIRLSNGRFITVLRSNVVTTPPSGPSWITDEEWMVPEDLFTRLYGMGVGLGSSPLNLKKIWQERLKSEFGSGSVTSPSSPVKKLVGPSEFWLLVNTELIVYGQTQPDASLTVGGQPVNLKPDGSFSLRFSLPDGKQVIPVVATSSDGKQVRNITPIVAKETR